MRLDTKIILARSTMILTMWRRCYCLKWSKMIQDLGKNRTVCKEYLKMRTKLATKSPLCMLWLYSSLLSSHLRELHSLRLPQRKNHIAYIHCIIPHHSIFRRPRITLKFSTQKGTIWCEDRECLCRLLEIKPN